MNKEKLNKLDEKKTTGEMVDMKPITSTIILNVSSMNTPVAKGRLNTQ